MPTPDEQAEMEMLDLVNARIHEIETGSEPDPAVQARRDELAEYLAARARREDREEWLR